MLYFSIKRCWILVLMWLVTQKGRVYHTVAEGTEAERRDWDYILAVHLLACLL